MRVAQRLKASLANRHQNNGRQFNSKQQREILNGCSGTLEITTVNDFRKWYCCHSKCPRHLCLQTDSLENSERSESIIWNIGDAINRTSVVFDGEGEQMNNFLTKFRQHAGLSPGHIGCDKLNNAIQRNLHSKWGWCVFKFADCAETRPLIIQQLDAARQTKKTSVTIVHNCPSSLTISHLACFHCNQQARLFTWKL